MSDGKRPDLFFCGLACEAYRRWQKKEEAKDAAASAFANRLAIENGDPEMEAVITALEQGWTEGR